MSVNNINPSKIFGGTWVAWGTGRTIVGIDTEQIEFDESEKMGGEKTHILSANEMPSHTHSFIGSSHNHGLNNHTHDWSGTTSWKDLQGSMWNFAVQSSTTGVSTNGIFNVNNSDTGGVAYAVNSKNSSNNYHDYVNINASHNHTVSGTTGGNSGNTTNTTVGGSNSNAGGGLEHNNLQPYITCYMWKRTA